MPSLLLLKGFVKKNYDGRTREAKQLIKDIDDYIKISRDYSRSGSHSEGFSRIKPFQVKHLVDITKGLDVMYCMFFTEDEMFIPAIKGGVTRNHNEEDPEYNHILCLLEEGAIHPYIFKLELIKFLTSHVEFQEKDNFGILVSEILEARMRHLFDLSQMEYDETISMKEYITIFEGLFSGKEDYIFHSNSKENIWGEFADGKVRKMGKDTIAEFVKRWISSKEMSEQSWYDRYYKKFYRGKFLPFMKNIYAYMRDRSNTWVKSEICEWFINTYLRDEALFNYKSLDSFINNI